MMQILVRKEGIDDLIECYRHIVVDNASTCPHCPFERFAERVLSQGERVMRNRANSFKAFGVRERHSADPAGQAEETGHNPPVVRVEESRP